MSCKETTSYIFSGTETTIQEVKPTKKTFTLSQYSLFKSRWPECVLTLQSYRRLRMSGTSHTCPQTLRVQSRHTGHTCISPCRCRQCHPPTCTPQCWCCSCSTPPSNRFHSDTVRSRTPRGLRDTHQIKWKAHHRIIVTFREWPLTSTEFSPEASTGVVVTLAVRSIDAAEAGCMTHTLAAVALPLTAACFGLIAGKAVAQHNPLLVALAPCSQEPRLAHAHAAMELSQALGALAAVCFRGLPAVARAKRLQFHLQTVLQAHPSEGEVPNSWQAPRQLHGHIEHDLRSKEEVRVRTGNRFRLCNQSLNTHQGPMCI